MTSYRRWGVKTSLTPIFTKTTLYQRGDITTWRTFGQILIALDQ